METPNVAHGTSEGDGVTKDERGELGSARSISETSSTAPCASYVGRNVREPVLKFCDQLRQKSNILPIKGKFKL